MNQSVPPAAANALWSIAEIERDTGLGKDALRVWERRYGFPQPVRDGRGDRLYDAAQFERLMLIKRLLDAGHRPGRIVPLPLPALQALLPTRSPEVQRPNVISLDGLPGWRELLEPGQPSELRAALRQGVRRLGLARAIEDWLAPLGRDIGAAWLAGELHIHQEHLFSEAVQAVLREAIAALESDTDINADRGRPRVLLATLAQEQHQIGLLMAECHFALAGCERITLGANLPLAEILASAARYQTDIVALSISAHAAPREVNESLRLLRERLPATVELWVGGGGVESGRRRLPAGLRRVSRNEQIGTELARWRCSGPGHREPATRAGA